MAKKQKSGLYRAKIKIGVDANGKSIFKYASGKTQKELERAKREIVEHYIDGRTGANDRLFGDYAVKWYETIKKPTISLSRQGMYKAMLNNLILPEWGDRNLRAILPTDCQGLINRLEGKSASNITLFKCIVNAIFNQACIDGILDRNPAEYISKPAHSEPKEKRAFTSEERERIERVCREDEQGAALACLYYLGLRRGEVMGLQWGDFDWKERIVHVQRDINPLNCQVDALKNKTSDRRIPMPQELIDILFPLRQMPTTFCFISKNKRGRFSCDVFFRMLKRLFAVCELPEDVTAHYFRHNYITMCWEHGIDVVMTSKLVGHSTPAITLKVYTHMNDEFLKQSRGRIDEMFSKKVAQKLHGEDGKD